MNIFRILCFLKTIKNVDLKQQIYLKNMYVHIHIILPVAVSLAPKLRGRPLHYKRNAFLKMCHIMKFHNMCPAFA